MKLASQLKTLILAGVTGLTLQAMPSAAKAQLHLGVSAPAHVSPLSPPEHSMRGHLRNFDARLDHQLQRILRGIEAGQLNRHEAVLLLREHTAINRLERQYLADGRLGPREMRELDERLDRASARIHEQRHDDEYRGWRDHMADNRDRAVPYWR